MKKNHPLALVAMPLALALVLAGCAGDDDESAPGMDHDGMSSSESPEAEADGEYNDADETFVTMMIPHHEQAVEMSDEILDKSGIDDRVVTLAEEIKDAQQPEIELMESWLQDWGVAEPDDDSMGHDGGMMTEAEMEALEAAEGDEAERLFLEGMIAHHEGAVDMAETEVEEGINPDALELAHAVIDTQTAEIATMEELVADL